tara:strand:+ start:54 stop:419 length:366 start_codon:yes stop_codon:yes gene_type:complete
MATCRLCRSVYPKEHFISGIGPRHLVCARCGLDHGYVTADEVPQMYDDETVQARMSLIGRRYSPVLWVILGWTFWFMFFSGLPLWGRASLVIMILSTLSIPVLFFLGSAKYQAELRRLSAK